MFFISKHKHISALRELSKFLTGLIAADLLVGVWVLASGGYPFDILGFTVTVSSIYAWMAADIVLLAFLAHYGWDVGITTNNPRRPFLLAAGILFLVVALAHLSRLLFDIPFDVAGVAIPYWLNFIGAIVAAFLSWASFAFAVHR